MSLDQYYTNPELAHYCFDLVKQKYSLDGYTFLEPSAGSGSFLSLMPKGSLAYDLDPRYPGIVEQDFLTVEYRGVDPLVTIGNPPFGKNSSLALKFFNHAAAMSEIIAFILPRTFRKASIQNKLDRNFHLDHDEILPRDSFMYEEQVYDVPCVFQMWKRGDRERPLIKVETSHPDFEFTTRDRADFALQRVGVRAGTIKTNLDVSEQSHYFIKGPVAEEFSRLDFDSVKYDTAGNPSIAKSEIVALYKEARDV